MLIHQERLQKIFSETLEKGSDLFYDGDINLIDHFNIMINAGLKDAMFKMFNCNMCMLNCLYEDQKSILVLASIPTNKSGNKDVAERVMNIIEQIENAFITIDYIESRQEDSEKFVYITIIKKLNENLEK